MKKSLVALAVLAATGAYAQSSVTLYGIVEATTDIGYKRTFESVTNTNGTLTNGLPAITNPGVAAPTMSAAGALVFTPVAGGSVVVRNEQRNGFRVQDGSDQGSGSSRVGFRGTEDLGGGLKANFQLEMGLRIDDGCTTLTAAGGCDNGGGSANSGGSTFGRNAWGGLSGGFGEVRVGRQVLGSFGVQGNSGASGASNGLYDASTATLLNMGGVRFSNAIRYLTPNLGGFTGSIMLAAPETGVPGAAGSDTSTNSTSTPITTGVGVVTSGGASRRTGVDLALEYANGPAYIGFGYNVRDGANTTSAFASNSALSGVGTSNAATGTPNGRVTAYTIGGSFDLGVVKPYINYTRQNNKTNRNDTFTPAAGGFAATIDTNEEVQSRAYSIGLRAPIGAFTVIAGYGRLNVSGVRNTSATQNQAGAIGSATTVQNAQNNQRVNAFQLGAQYALSKRTLIETNYGYNRLQNNTDATTANNFAASSGTQSIRASTRISAFNVGLKHSF